MRLVCQNRIAGISNSVWRLISAGGRNVKEWVCPAFRLLIFSFTNCIRIRKVNTARLLLRVKHLVLFLHKLFDLVLLFVNFTFDFSNFETHSADFYDIIQCQLVSGKVKTCDEICFYDFPQFVFWFLLKCQLIILVDHVFMENPVVVALI
jgi:hypothetical protein